MGAPWIDTVPRRMIGGKRRCYFTPHRRACQCLTYDPIRGGSAYFKGIIAMMTRAI
jgi:hypothetical protein